MSLPKSLAEVRRLEELAFRGWPALESRDLAGWRLRFSGGYTKRANSINALGPDAQMRRRDPAAPRGALPGARPAAGLAADAARPARHRPTSWPSAATGDRAQPAAGLPARTTASPPIPRSAILPRPTPAWIEAFCAHSPVRPRASRDHAAHAGGHRRARRLRLGRGGRPADGHGDRRGRGRPHGPVRRAGDARRPAAAAWRGGSPRASMPGHGSRARASPICRSSPPTQAAMPLYAAQGFRTRLRLRVSRALAAP